MLWLQCRLAATALIRPLAWEAPYAVGAALEKTKDKKKKNLYSDSVILPLKFTKIIHELKVTQTIKIPFYAVRQRSFIITTSNINFPKVTERQSLAMCTEYMKYG